MARRQSGLIDWWHVGVLLVLGALLLYIVAWFLGESTGQGFFVAALASAVIVPRIARLRSTERSFDLAGVVLTGFGVKLIAIYARYWMVEHLYNGVADSTGYDGWGRRLAPQLQNLDFGIDPEKPIPGTGFLRVLTAVVYAIFGQDYFSGFIIFGLLGFAGCWFFYRAFEDAVPDGDHKRYAILLFLWPSLVFWPSSIGKEAWMVFSLGLASAGAAAAFARKPHGYPMLGLGILCAAMPRPHIAIVVLAAATCGLMVSTLFGAGAGGRRATLTSKLVGIAFLAIAAALLVPRVATFLKIDDVDASGFTETLERTQDRSTKGGSEFEAAGIDNVAEYPWGFTTVLFRPFPYEARGAESAVAAVEGLLLLGLCAFSVRRLASLPAFLVRNAYIAYAASFAFMFGYVFSFIGNFGILARQRVQLLPFLLILLSLPAVSAVRERSTPRPRPEIGTTARITRRNGVARRSGGSSGRSPLLND